MDKYVYRILASSALSEVKPRLIWGKPFWFDECINVQTDGVSFPVDTQMGIVNTFWHTPEEALAVLQNYGLSKRPWQVWKFPTFAIDQNEKPVLHSELTVAGARALWNIEHGTRDN